LSRFFSTHSNNSIYKYKCALFYYLIIDKYMMVSENVCLLCFDYKLKIYKKYIINEIFRNCYLKKNKKIKKYPIMKNITIFFIINFIGIKNAPILFLRIVDLHPRQTIR